MYFFLSKFNKEKGMCLSAKEEVSKLRITTASRDSCLNQHVS
jgi:hypothetical protein